ncbi:protein AE7 [Quercus suber]|uniref:protein AE7 n=1 Tax=Quercus suber TaxID=58331 RepID=UPI0032DE7532
MVFELINANPIVYEKKERRARSMPTAVAEYVDIRVAPGSHASESAVNKQLNDKERVAAALENPNLVDMVDECLAPSYD